ncbi:MAG: ATP-dependent RNA helicase [Candidatus Uhrbacteria bacterium]
MTDQLPVLGFKEAIIKTVSDNPVSIIQADTGAGKTTQVPLMLLGAGFGRRGAIGITQPRRIAAVSMADYVARLHGSELGNIIGYQIKGDRAMSGATCVKFMTEGILLRELHSDPELRRYEVVIVDEAHDREINQDLLLALLRKVRGARPSLRVVIMSATIDAARFSAHFDHAPVITIPGRLFPVEVRYASETPVGMKDLLSFCAETIERITRSRERGDVLVFLPDEKSIHAVEGLLGRQRIAGIRILPLFRNQSKDEQHAVFQRTPLRRVILATNIAETSLTIDGVVHVVDSGLVKQEQYVNASMSALVVTEHSKAGCDQRKGRAGRTQPGICHRLFCRDDFGVRPDFTEPEIRRTALDQILLHLHGLGYTLDEVKELTFIDPPGDDRWDEAETRLQALGALDANGAVTPDGERMERLPVAPMLGRMILEAERYGCLEEIVTVVAGFTARPVFLKAKDRDAQAEVSTAQREFMDPSSDALTLLKVWGAWCAAGDNGRRKEWARMHRLSICAFREIEREREHLFGVLQSLDVAVTSNTDPVAVRKAVAAGLMTNLCAMRGGNCYAWHDRADVFVHPGSSTFSAHPRYMVCAEIVETTKAFARNCTAVEEGWIADLIPKHLLVRQWRIERPLFSEGVSVVESVSWQGMVLTSRAVVEFPAEAIPVVAEAILQEIMGGGRGLIHPHSAENQVVWRVLEDALALEPCLTMTDATVEQCSVLARVCRFFADRFAGVTTIAEVRQRDLRLRLEDFLTPEQVATHRERVAAEQATIETERRAREEREGQERERREREKQARAGLLDPLRKRIEDLRQRINGLTGDRVERIRSELERAARELDWEWVTADEIQRTIGTLEGSTASVEIEQHDKIELSDLGWQAVLDHSPVCPFCGSAWREFSGRSLRCSEKHDRQRLIPDGRMTLGRFTTNRDEGFAQMTMDGDGGVMIHFQAARTQAWSGRKFKTVRFEPCAAILPSELVSQRDAILCDLEEFNRARQEVEAVAQRVREIEATGASVRRLTFRVVDGLAVAENGSVRYQSAFQDPYPSGGETWFCRIGGEFSGSGRRIVEVQPVFKAGAVSNEQDLEELRTLLRETYPGLPEHSFLPP